MVARAAQNEQTGKPATPVANEPGFLPLQLPPDLTRDGRGPRVPGDPAYGLPDRTQNQNLGPTRRSRTHASKDKKKIYTSGHSTGIPRQQSAVHVLSYHGEAIPTHGNEVAVDPSDTPELSAPLEFSETSESNSASDSSNSPLPIEFRQLSTPEAPVHRHHQLTGSSLQLLQTQIPSLKINFQLPKIDLTVSTNTAKDLLKSLYGPTDDLPPPADDLRRIEQVL